MTPYAKGGELPGVFATRDDRIHKMIRGPIAPMFSQTEVMTYEGSVDEVLDVMCRQLDERYAASGKALDFDRWLQYFAFDVMGTLTFSNRYGFLETGQDPRGILKTIWAFMKRAAPVRCKASPPLRFPAVAVLNVRKR